jgi:hypothetical protein
MCEGEGFDNQDPFARDIGIPLVRVARLRAQIAEVCGGPVRELDPGYLAAVLGVDPPDRFAYYPFLQPRLGELQEKAAAGLTP